MTIIWYKSLMDNRIEMDPKAFWSESIVHQRPEARYCALCHLDLSAKESVVIIESWAGSFYHINCYKYIWNSSPIFREVELERKEIDKLMRNTQHVEVNGLYPVKVVRFTANYCVVQVMRADKPFTVYIPRFNFHSEVSVGQQMNIIIRPGMATSKREILEKEINNLKSQLVDLQNKLELATFNDE
jgi:hypothetical protein